MLASVAVVLPVFALIGIGYVARQVGLVTDRAGEGLSEFVFALAVPCLIFRTLVTAEVPAAQPCGSWPPGCFSRPFRHRFGRWSK